MANARVGCVVPRNTNLTHPEIPHLILGPFKIPAANTTIYTNMLVVIDTSGSDIAVHTSKTKPDGVVLWGYRNTPNWGDTTPGHFTLIPSEVEVYVCVWGPVICAIDTSDIADACGFGTPVFESAVAGLVCCPASAAAVETDTDEAGHMAIGTCMDFTAGNTGTGTGAADGDPIEVFLTCCIPHGQVST